MRKLFDEMAVMMASRIASLAIGLLMIPLLLHYIGGKEFAAWALYVAVGLGFSMFESAASNTLVRFVAPAAKEVSKHQISRIVSSMTAIHVVAYAAFLPLVVLGAAPFSQWIRLPEGVFGSPAEVIVLLYFAAGLRAVLLLGQLMLFAGGSLRWFSLSSFALSFLGNVATVVAAAHFSRADATIAASWSVQLVLLSGFAVVSWRRYGWRLRIDYVDRGVMKEILRHGLQLQLKSWAHFFNYQLDKFLIAALTGLWAVGPYEVANRAVVALRSVPISGLALLLPEASAHAERRGDVTTLYRETTRYAAFGALLFLGAPLAASWFFMFAWAGEIGYYARWAFPALGLGTMVAMVAVPAVILLQAEGRPDVEAKAAGISVLLNLPLSLLVIPRYGAAGAAFAIGVATVAGAIWILVAFHRMHGLTIRDTLVDLWGTVREAAVPVAVVGVVATVSFKVWFTPQLPVTGYSASARVVPALIACAIGGVCCLMVLWSARTRLAGGWFPGRGGGGEDSAVVAKASGLEP